MNRELEARAVRNLPLTLSTALGNSPSKSAEFSRHALEFGPLRPARRVYETKINQ